MYKREPSRRLTQSLRGFSFIEVIFAMVILSISLVILMDSQSQSMDLVGRARAMDFASTLASSKMAEITQLVQEKGITAIPEEERGEFDQEKYPGYRWRYSVSDVETPNLSAMMTSMMGGEDSGDEGASNAALFAGPLKQIQEIWGKSLNQLRIEVFWLDGKREREYSLVTHLLTPDAVNQVQAMIGGMTGGAQSSPPTPGGAPRGD